MDEYDIRVESGRGAFPEDFLDDVMMYLLLCSGSNGTGVGGGLYWLLSIDFHGMV